MVFGLCNAPTTFSRLVNSVLTGLKWEICLAYLDNIIAFAKDWHDYDVFQPKRAAPLHTLLHKGATWEWTDTCQTTFQTLKDKLLEQPVATYPNFDISFRLYTDASSLQRHQS